MSYLIQRSFNFLHRALSFAERKLTPHSESKLKSITMDVREIFIQQNKETYNRLDTVVRYLAIENYHGQNSIGFALYEKMQAARMGKEWVEGSVSRFKSLIASYDEKGYQKDSEILLDCNLELIDGSHRVAMGLYYKEYELSCKVDANPYNVEYGLSWFIENQFTEEEINIILDKCKMLLQQSIVPFFCILWAPVQSHFDEIVNLMKLQYEVLDYKDYESNDSVHKYLINHCYDLDQNEFAESLIGSKIRVISLEMKHPRFKLNESTLTTYSILSESLKRMYINAYRERISSKQINNGIIYVAKNYTENEQLRKLI